MATACMHVVRTSLLASLSRQYPVLSTASTCLAPTRRTCGMAAISPTWTSNFSGVNESLTRPIDAPYSCMCVCILPSVGVHVPTVVAYLGFLVGFGMAVHGSGPGRDALS